MARTTVEKCSALELGDIYFTKKGLRSDVGHGIGRGKVAAFATVPDILTKGKILRISPNWNGRGYRSFVIGAPIEIAYKRYLAIAVVNEVTEKNRGISHGNFYLHEVSLQEIPPEASDVSSQQAYHDDGVFHAAAETREVAPARAGDGTLATSADTARPSRGDSSSNEGLLDAQTASSRGTQQPSPLRNGHRSSAASDVSQQGDIHTLLNKVINVNSLPEITPEAINANAPVLHATRLSGGVLLLEGKGGAQIFVDNRDEPLSINSEAFRQEYGRDVTPDDIATGRTIVMGKKAFIDLVAASRRLRTYKKNCIMRRKGWYCGRRK